MEDVTYNKMFNYALSLLKWESSMTNIRNGTVDFKYYNKELIINWTFKRLNTNHKNSWIDENIFDEDVIVKVNKLEEWIMKEYKTVEYMRKYNKEYYHNVRKFKDGRMGNIKVALGTCKYYKWKPTIAKLMELTQLGKTTVIKYKKILMPKI